MEDALVSALKNLEQMRLEEGRVMAADLGTNCRSIAEQLGLVEQRAPAVVDSYRVRLTERLTNLLAENDLPVDQLDLTREVGLFR